MINHKIRKLCMAGQSTLHFIHNMNVSARLIWKIQIEHKFWIRIFFWQRAITGKTRLWLLYSDFSSGTSQFHHDLDTSITDHSGGVQTVAFVRLSGYTQLALASVSRQSCIFQILVGLVKVFGKHIITRNVYILHGCWRQSAWSAHLTRSSRKSSALREIVIHICTYLNFQEKSANQWNYQMKLASWSAGGNK